MANAPTAGEPEASSRDAGPPGQVREPGKRLGSEAAGHGAQSFYLCFLKRPSSRAELDLLKLRLNPGGAPGGAERLLPVKKTVGYGRGPPRVSASALQCHPHSQPHATLGTGLGSEGESRELDGEALLGWKPALTGISSSFFS